MQALGTATTCRERSQQYLPLACTRVPTRSLGPCPQVYLCLVDGCARKFCTVEERKQHLQVGGRGRRWAARSPSSAAIVVRSCCPCLVVIHSLSSTHSFSSNHSFSNLFSSSLDLFVLSCCREAASAHVCHACPWPSYRLPLQDHHKFCSILLSL